LKALVAMAAFLEDAAETEHVGDDPIGPISLLISQWSPPTFRFSGQTYLR